MKIVIDVSEENEGTAEPWWLIVDPKQMMSPDPAAVAMGMISGPFFSREEAESVLKSRRHHYSKRAVVWCHSAWNTIQYKEKYREAEKKEKESKMSNTDGVRNAPDIGKVIVGWWKKTFGKPEEKPDVPKDLCATCELSCKDAVRAAFPKATVIQCPDHKPRSAK